MFDEWNRRWLLLVILIKNSSSWLISKTYFSGLILGFFYFGSDYQSIVNSSWAQNLGDPRIGYFSTKINRFEKYGMKDFFSSKQINFISSRDGTN